MTMTVVRSASPACEPDCPHWLQLDGEISAGSVGLFRNAVKQMSGFKLPVIINSGGGNLDAAEKIGAIIRKNGLTVVVGQTRYPSCEPGQKTCAKEAKKRGYYLGLADDYGAACFSACTFILAAGTTRIAGPGALIGVHQARETRWREWVRYQERYRIINGKKKIISRKVISRKRSSTVRPMTDRKSVARFQSYFKSMGISPDIVTAMNQTAAKDINILTMTERQDFGIVSQPGRLQDVVGIQACGGVTRAAFCVHMEPKATPAAPNLALADPASKVIRPDMPVPDAAASDPRFKPMRFRVVRVPVTECVGNLCAHWIAAEGLIDAHTPERFRDFLGKLSGRQLPVAFDSPGGDVKAAMELGRLIRDHGLPTMIGTTRYLSCMKADLSCADGIIADSYKGLVVNATPCVGACVVAFVGGTLRSATPSSRLFDGVAAIRQVGYDRAALRNYLRSMAVDEEMASDVEIYISGDTTGRFVEQALAKAIAPSRGEAGDYYQFSRMACAGYTMLPNCLRVEFQPDRK